MNVLRTPDDSTAVLRIMGEFNQFLSDSEVSGLGDPKLRLTYDDVTEPLSSSSKTTENSFTDSKPSRAMIRSQSGSVILGKDREKEIELIKNRSKIAHLESQLNSVESSRKRARVEHEKDCQVHKHELIKRSEDMEDLEQTVQYALDQEKFAKEQLNDIKKEYEMYKTKAERKASDLQRAKLKLTSEIEEIKEENSKKHLDLRNSVTRLEADKIITQNKLEECEAQLEIFKRRYTAAAKNLTELEELRMEAKTATQRVKDLELKISQQEDAASIAMTMKNQLSRYRELEKQNFKLEEDNCYYRETNENNLLLKEQMESMRTKLQRAEQRLKDLTMMEIENEELKKRIKKWEVEDSSSGKKTASPAQLTHEISKLQKSQVVLLEKQSGLMASAQIHESAHKKAKSEINSLLKEVESLKESESKYQEQCQKLQRRLFMITAERDGNRRILNVYDSDLSSNYEPQLRDRLKETEQRLNMCQEHIEKVENEISQAKQETRSEKSKVKQIERQLAQAQAKMAGQPSAGSTSIDTSDMKTEINKLKEENKTLAEKLEVFELRKEQMHIQGYYDPYKTKVIHLSMNPATMARQQKAEDNEKLQQENEALRAKLQGLEGKSPSGVTASNITPCSSKEVEEVKAQLSSSELRNQRLKEVFSKKIQEFREACYALTGYKIDVLRDKQYRLQSMYAERSSDDLLFESSTKGEMMLLETDFSSQVREHIDTYLKRMNSIPAFLSNVTLDLFGKQTTTIVIN